MANPTQNANALTFLADTVSFAAQLRSLYDFARSIRDRQAAHNYAANLQAMPTYAVAADGSQGVADATPVQGHPIAGQNATFFALDQGRINLVVDLVSLVEGAAVATLDRRPTINALLP